MIQVRKSEDRGFFDHGWVKTYHTFSFGDYHDPEYMGYRKLRVINEDTILPNQGFATHAHRDMEIITYILSGTLSHKDSTGNASEIKAGEIQRMSAGTGIRHSEFNASSAEPVHLLQIWIEPSRKGLQPGYEQKILSLEGAKNQLILVASEDGDQESVSLNQDMRLYSVFLEKGKQLSYEVSESRGAWLQVIRGSLQEGPLLLAGGDGAAISSNSSLSLKALEESEFLLFDLA